MSGIYNKTRFDLAKNNFSCVLNLIFRKYLMIRSGVLGMCVQTCAFRFFLQTHWLRGMEVKFKRMFSVLNLFKFDRKLYYVTV